MASTCKACKTAVEDAINFCPSCGTAIHQPNSVASNDAINLIIVFYVVELLFLIAVYFFNQAGSSLTQEIVIESISATIVVGFVCLDFKNVIALYKFPRINPILYLGAIIIPIGTALVVYYGLDVINGALFDNVEDNYYTAYVGYNNPVFWAVLFIAITPPIFEELAYRGFLFNQLQKVTSTRVTIIVTAFIFALVHFSVLSLIWIFPFGLLLGYLRHKYNTLWIGMIIHFVHNLIVLSLDYYYYHNTLDSILNL